MLRFRDNATLPLDEAVHARHVASCGGLYAASITRLHFGVIDCSYKLNTQPSMRRDAARSIKSFIDTSFDSSFSR